MSAAAKRNRAPSRAEIHGEDEEDHGPEKDHAPPGVDSVVAVCENRRVCYI